jgi:mannose-6-phosphate isomerase-like protein (cupin superfamily)
MEPINIQHFKGHFFKILQQTPLSQIGVMTLKPKGDSGPEDIHEGDQIVYILEGDADVEIGQKRHHLMSGMLAIIPAKTRHHIYNVGSSDLFFLTIYTPPAY